MRNYTWYGLFGITLFLAITLSAKANDYRFNVTGRSEIEQEITVARLLPFYQYMGGRVEVQWANPELTASVDKLVRLLVKEGVHQQDIVRNYSQSMAAKNQSRDSINVVLNTLTRRNNCSAYRLLSSFNALGEEGCALNDNIDAMKIRK